MTSPIATIIVVTHNSARWLARMVAAVAAQSETRWRLIVVDNASAPAERPSPRDLPAGAVLIQNEANLGFAAANNQAAQAASTPYLVFLNPDAFPEPGWLAALTAAAARFPQAAAFGSTQMRADADGVFDGVGDVVHASGLAYRAWYGRKHASAPPVGESFAACGAAMLVRRDAFEAVGGFDGRYFCYFEDVDLCFRLRLRGARIVQLPEAVVAHVGGGVASSASAFAQFHGARNRLWTFVKCMPGPLFWPLFPVHALASAAVVTLSALRGRGLASWRGLLAALSDLGPALRARREIQSARTATTGDIARALAWSPLVFFGRQPVIRPLR